MTRFKQFYHLTKPGIIYGNALTLIGGFLLASNGRVDYWLFLAMLSGTSLVIAAGCVFNNYIDRDIDKLMARTKKRALVSGIVSGPSAITYATLLGILGFLILGFYTNLLTVIVGVIGLINYVVLYGISKRRSVHGTLVGSISGAAPVVAGYTAVTNRFDMGAFLLFLILVCWQMSHFYAIAVRRQDDYTAAGLPVLPVSYGVQAAKNQIIFYTAAFIVATATLTVFDYTGYTYSVVMLGLGFAWLWRAIQGLRAKNNMSWARQMFQFSLVVILAFSIMLSINNVLP